MPKPIAITLLLNLLDHFKLMVMATLSRLGLAKQTEDEYGEESATSYILPLDLPCPSLFPIPVHVLISSIKKKVPVIEYSDFLQKFGEDHEDVKRKCAICLSCIERSHMIRELLNCSHVFHRECLDTWVDENQVTCPLCRSMLFPTKVDMTSCPGNPWMMMEETPTG